MNSKAFPCVWLWGHAICKTEPFEVARRDTLEKSVLPIDGIEQAVVKLLDDIQQNIFNKALKYREENTTIVDDYNEFKRLLDEKGGFFLCHWVGTSETEALIKDENKSHHSMHTIGRS
jgi:prolyl-tRNA synthetase